MLGFYVRAHLRGARNIRRKIRKRIPRPLPLGRQKEERKMKAQNVQLSWWMLPVHFLASRCTRALQIRRVEVEKLGNIKRRVVTATPRGNSAAVSLTRKKF
jgi:hypothetical protein